MLPRLPLTRAEFKAMPIVGMNDPDPAPEVKRWRYQSIDGDWFARGDRTTVESHGYLFPIFTHRVARKPHTCSWCGQKILAGERYARWCWIDGHDAMTIQMHVECNAACDKELHSYEDTFELYQNARPAPTPVNCSAGLLGREVLAPKGNP